MSGSSGGQRRTTPDTEPQASPATRQAPREASWLRDEEADGSEPAVLRCFLALRRSTGGGLRRKFLATISIRGVVMIGALFLGLFCGIVARMLVPGDAFRNMSGPRSWLLSLVLGLVGAFVGYLIFTVGIGIGDTTIFDWGGVLSALIGTVIVLLIATWALRRTSRRSAGQGSQPTR